MTRQNFWSLGISRLVLTEFSTMAQKKVTSFYLAHAHFVKIRNFNKYLFGMPVMFLLLLMSINCRRTKKHKRGDFGSKFFIWISGSVGGRSCWNPSGKFRSFFCCLMDYMFAFISNSLFRSILSILLSFDESFWCFFLCYGYSFLVLILRTKKGLCLIHSHSHFFYNAYTQ